MKSMWDARFTMWATVMPRLETAGTDTDYPTTGGAGAYELTQDPDSGQIVTTFDTKATPASPYGLHAGGERGPFDIKCYARGYTALGYRSSANRQVLIAEDYTVIEVVQFDFQKSVTLNHQSIVSNIRTGQDAHSPCLFVSEETGEPLAWEIQGVTPVHDPFGKWIRNTTALKRADIQ